MKIYNVYQSGKRLYIDEKENPDNKIVVNKYDNMQQTLRLISDGTLPPRLYWALRNLKLSNKYFILKLIDNKDLIVGTDISATPGLWDMLLIGTDDDYIIEGADIDQSRLTYVSDHFGRLFVRDNFLEELDFEEQCSPTFEVFYNEILDKIAEFEKGGMSEEEIKKAIEEYLTEHPFEVPVSSVNNKIGDVELTAKDVGALSENDVDDELSMESTNPIQNKVVAAKIKELEDATPEITTDSDISKDSTNPIQNQAVAKEFNKFGGTVEITDGEPDKENTVLTVNPNGEEVYIYTAEEIDEKLRNIPTGEVSDEQIVQVVENYLEENPIEVDVPTKTSDLINDSGYLTEIVTVVDANGDMTFKDVTLLEDGNEVAY